MSLFKAREWWSTAVGENEEFDRGCLCVGNLDNNKDKQDKIVVGSFHGFIRIYCPRPQKLDSGGWSGFKAEDVICESHLGLPVLQVEIGRFVSGSENLHLAVLHPRKLTVFTLIGSPGRAEHGTQYQLKQLYEHNLQRTAFNFCYGPFGSVQGKDFVCIQSMDGTLAVFEQESFAFSRFLPGALLPGPISYVQRLDSFVTVSSQRQVESYKYQVLATATDTKSKEESQALRSGKRVACDWTYNIGECALDLMVFPVTSAGSASIYVLGERSLFVLTESGKLRFMKKFDFNPSCFLPFAAVGGSINCVIATHSNALLIFNDVTLKWAAQLTHVPVQLRVANFTDLRGVVVTLTEQGQLSCSYMGTDPSMFTPPSSEVRELDYAELDREMKQLQRAIKENSGKAQTINLPSSKSDVDLDISVIVSGDLDEPSNARDVEFQDEDPVPSISVKLVLKAKTHINDVQLTITVATPLVVSENFISYPSLDPTHAAENVVCFYMKYAVMPHTLTADVSASFLTSTGAPRVVHSQIKLPARLVIKPMLPVKTSTFKITIDTNKPPVNLNELFPDLLSENGDTQGNALGFRYYGQESIVTVLASKTSKRYRLQSDQFECIWLLLNELVKRLSGYFARANHSDFRVTFDGPIPLQEYFDIIDRHFECRSNEDKFNAMMEERAQQFRAIQRRLLTRFKDKTPSPLANLDTLLDGTYRQLMALADHVAENERHREQCTASLIAAVKMTNTLIRYWQNLNDTEFAILEQAMTPNVHDSIQHGWEEMVDASITHLLRTCLSKSTKDQTVNPSPLTLMKDSQKIKKHIALLCDRLSKGAKLQTDGQQPITAKSSNQTTSESKRPAARPSLSSKDRVEVPNLADLQRVYPSQSVNGSRSSSAMSSVLGNADIPVGSRFGDSRSHMEAAAPSLASLGLPSLSNGAADDAKLPDLSAPLPPLNDTGGRDRYIKKKDSLQQQVPDLDDMTGDGLVNGTKELVFDMDQLGL